MATAMFSWKATPSASIDTEGAAWAARAAREEYEAMNLDAWQVV